MIKKTYRWSRKLIADQDMIYMADQKKLLMTKKINNWSRKYIADQENI